MADDLSDEDVAEFKAIIAEGILPRRTFEDEANDFEATLLNAELARLESDREFIRTAAPTCEPPLLPNWAIQLEFAHEDIEVALVEVKIAGITSKPESAMALFNPGSHLWRLNGPQMRRFTGLERWIDKYKKRRKKSAYRAQHPEKTKEQGARDQRTYASAHPDRIRAKQGRELDDNYHRPFVAIDAEGQNYPGDDIIVSRKDRRGNEYREVYPNHKTFLWGAGGWKRAHSSSVMKRMSDEDARAASMREGANIDFHWLGSEDKRPLGSYEILEWLVASPARYKLDVNFVAFAFNYDATQALADLPRDKVWEICRKKNFKSKRRVLTPTLVGPFAIDYLKSKWLKVWRLRDRDKPFVDKLDRDGNVVLNSNGKPVRQIDASASIVIHDAFGFYQKRFTSVTKSLCDQGYFLKEHHDIIVREKENRAEFDQRSFDIIKEYCGLELIGLSKALTILRDGFDKMEIRLKAWSGAGAAAGALIKKEQLNKNHYSPDISKLSMSPQQDAAHHAYFGGNIQLVKQGFSPNTPLWAYDIVSAYPAVMTGLPSMRDGRWEHRDCFINFSPRDDRDFTDYGRGNLQSLRKLVESADVLSMFNIIWRFPECRVAKVKNRFHYGLPIPFYPFPYRTKNGAVLYPSSGKSWIMRDEVLAALKWVETFFPDTASQSKIDFFAIKEQWRFIPGNDEKPYAFIRKLFDMRRAAKQEPVYNIVEMAIKLTINSLYGKTAQSIGGSPDKPPPAACPYYAAATTAGTRARMIEAACAAPDNIVMFATDGIISTTDLVARGLEHVPEKPDLGDWEYAQHAGGFFLQSGVYTIYNSAGKSQDKTRGMDPRNFITKTSMDEFARSNILPEWRKPFDREDPPAAPITMRNYVTAGSAAITEPRWKLAGRWTETKRLIDVHNAGVKRDVNIFGYPRLIISGSKTARRDGDIDDYAELTGLSREQIELAFERDEALRCSALVPTLPAKNPTPDELSRPRYPEWLGGDDYHDDDDYGDVLDSDDLDTANIVAGGM